MAAGKSGFKALIDSGNWTITRGVHYMAGSGFTTSPAPEVKSANGAAESDDSTA
ncbi:hypothetical protein H650_15685 [Enterobacter sp. R4-368]|nr:hypothetical protein H650_15685 [Enterobacter sp. R4-368]